MKRIAVIIALVFSCTSPDRARSALSAEGFTEIEITGHEWTTCGNSDSTCTGFTARSSNGRTVHGAVGCGYDVGGCGKGCTIRLD